MFTKRRIQIQVTLIRRLIEINDSEDKSWFPIGNSDTPMRVKPRKFPATRITLCGGLYIPPLNNNHNVALTYCVGSYSPYIRIRN